MPNNAYRCGLCEFIHELKGMVHERTHQTFTVLPTTVHMQAALLACACMKALQHDVCLAQPSAVAK